MIYHLDRVYEMMKEEPKIVLQYLGLTVSAVFALILISSFPIWVGPYKIIKKVQKR